MRSRAVPQPGAFLHSFSLSPVSCAAIDSEVHIASHSTLDELREKLLEYQERCEAADRKSLPFPQRTCLFAWGRDERLQVKGRPRLV